MADNIDLANALIDKEVSEALNKMRNQSNVQGQATNNCVECGEGLPAERKKLGFRLCVSCAEYLEKKRSRFAD